MIFLVWFVLILIIAVLIIQIPIRVAVLRGITGSELSAIRILAWCGLLFGITWVVALILSLVWKPGDWVAKDTNLDKLEKLHKLLKSGAITKSEFDREKKKLI